MLAVLKRELRAYFTTPTGYVFMGLFLLVAGFFFAYTHLFTGSSYYTNFLQNILFIYLFAIPLLTMRLISEDRRRKTDQLLLTSPVKISGIVLGKYFAAFALYLMTLLVTVLYAVIVAVYGDLAVWETLGAYIGFILIGGAFISIGLMVSALTENQVSSAFFTFFALLFIWLIDLVQQVVPQDLVAGFIFTLFAGVGIAVFFFLNTRNLWVTLGVGVLALGAAVVAFLVDNTLFQGLIGRVLEWFSLLGRFEDFNLGILSLDGIVYYLSFTAVFLFITVRVLEKRRWA
jgi:ABC-2 type transport system permease protein